MNADLALRLFGAMGIGLLIGLERGWRTRDMPDGSRPAGIRTFGLSGLLGGVAGALIYRPQEPLSLAGAVLLSGGMLVFGATMLVFDREHIRATRTFSATTTVAALLTYLLGALAVLGDMRLAAGIAVAAAGILLLRDELHRWIRLLSPAEIDSSVLLLAMTFVALPLLPSGPVATLGGIDLRSIWIIATVLAGVSFGGYVAVKLLGERSGVLVSAAAGGIVSSTAIVLANARQSSKSDLPVHLLAAGASLASAVAYVRMLILASALRPSLFAILAPALAAAATISTLLAALWSGWPGAQRSSVEASTLRNPFKLRLVLTMAAIMGLSIHAARILYAHVGLAALYASSTVLGALDIDALIVAGVNAVPLSAPQFELGTALLLGVASDTGGKMLLAMFLGSRAYAWRVAMQGAAAICVGIIVSFWTLRP